MRLDAVTPALAVTPARSLAGAVDVRPLTPRVTGTLGLAHPDQDGRSFVSAASGIASDAAGGAWVISDVYGNLVRFAGLDAPGVAHVGLPPTKSTKKHKPDLESVLVVPATASEPSFVFSAGSGSTERRNRGVVLPIDAEGAPVGAATAIDLTELFAEFDRRLPLQPNIEAMALQQGERGAKLLFFHRGKLADDVSTIFTLDAAAAISALRAGRPIPASAIEGQKPVELGTLGGERLAFTDARALPDGRIAFLASAEGADAVGDGAIKGSVLGLLDGDLNVTALRPFHGTPRKAEGIELARALDPTAGPDEFVVVTDPDDPARSTEVLRLDLAEGS